ncbi:hypothetical protein I4U23_011592 [Adineta vaga]|nr:hypothetical protein I4U23_011592 [Adineta vaga]
MNYVSCHPLRTSDLMTGSTAASLVNPCSNGIYWNVTRTQFWGTGTSNIGLNQLSSPTGLFIDIANNNLYIADGGNYRVIRHSLSVTTNAPNGTIVAGITNVTGNSSFSDRFSTAIRYLYVDGSQNLYVSDTYNNRVMRWANGASSGVMVAGNGSFGSSLNQVYYPYGIWVDSGLNIFVAEYQLHRVTKWAPGATAGVLVAGVAGSSGNTTDKLASPSGIYYDESNQDLYIANSATATSTVMKWRVGAATVIKSISNLRLLSSRFPKNISHSLDLKKINHIIMSLTYIGQQITIYGGFCFLVTGVFGNAINVCIFSTIRSYRTNPSTFYFFVGSIFNIAYIMINLTSRIATGYGIDLTRTSSSWCKARNYFLYTLAMIALTCPCMAMIDQFLVTSRYVKLRSLSNIRWAHRLVGIMTIIWILLGIPPALFYDISLIKKTCLITNNIFGVYRSIFLLGLLTTIPATITSLFGYLTYRNIHSIRALANQHADQQILRMTLFQVVLVNACLIPYASIVTYSYITENETKDTTRIMRESFVMSLFALWNYGYYAGTCYVFFISSQKFRRAIRDRILFWRPANQINTVLPMCDTVSQKRTIT